VPIIPYVTSGYFLHGLVDKDLVREANNPLLVARAQQARVPCRRPGQ